MGVLGHIGTKNIVRLGTFDDPCRRYQVGHRQGLACIEDQIFDLHTKPNILLTRLEEAEVKKPAKALLEKMKQEKLVNLLKPQTTRAMVFTTIKDVPDELPRA